MKLWQCDWVPTSVVDWLCRELDERGIPGTTYTHTLLSLLHPYFCPHPVPREPSHLPKGFLNSECINSILRSGQCQDLEILFEDLEEHVHPDADFPELNTLEHLKEGTRRSKKRQKRKLQQLSLSPEKIWKIAALQCLLTASDEHQNIESVVEELFLRLKSSSKRDSAEEEKSGNQANLQGQEDSVDTSVTSEDFISVESVTSYSCYSSNFPPLSNPQSDTESIIDETRAILNWKSLIKDQLSPKKAVSSEECDPVSIQSRKALRDVSNTYASLTTVCEQNSKEKTDMEITPIGVENEMLDKNAYCFVPICNEEARQQSLEPSTREPLESEGCSFSLKPSIGKVVIEAERDNKLEEWECTGNLVTDPAQRALSVDLLGNRLFERSIGSTDTTRCNSNTDLAIFQTKGEDESPIAPVWPCATNPEGVWNTSTYIPHPFNGSEAKPEVLGSTVLPVPIQQMKDKTVGRLKEFNVAETQIDKWPPNRNWCSLSTTDLKNDPIFSSAFCCSPHRAYKEGARQDCKISVSDICDENLKSIWSDFNDNITGLDQQAELSEKKEGRGNSPNDHNFDQGPHKETEEKLCESFKKLGLELLWDDPMKIDSSYLSDESYMTKSFGSSSSSVNIFDDFTKNSREQNFISEEVYRMKCAQKKEIEDKFLLHKIPSGPSGPYVELRHRETSGFQAVIPTKNIPVVPEDGNVPGEISSITPMFLESSLDPHVTSQEEENLLTSPRTHFRPIRQDSHGSIEEAKSEDGQAIPSAANIQDPDFVFQRSGSGTLYLESDLLKGSPKKYMAYREPPAKIPGAVNTTDVVEAPIFPQTNNDIPSVSFVPKFKLVNNEKFCQTEGPDGTIMLEETLGKELESKIFKNHMKKYDHLYKQHSGEGSGQLWESSYPNNIKMIWEEHPKQENKEAWELELAAPLHYPKWSTQDFSQTDWSNKVLPRHKPLEKEPHNKMPIYKHLGEEEPNPLNHPDRTEEDTLSKIKFIWHNFKDKASTPSPTVTAPNSMTVGSDFLSQSGPSFSDSWSKNQPPLDSRFQVDVPRLGSSLVIPKSPWTIGLAHQKEERDFNSLKREDASDVPSRWQLQWEVDQEADEILGGLLPTSPLKASPPYESTLRNSVHARDGEKYKIMDFLGDQEQHQQPPIEDLDHLEPGWDLNDGFEWGPATEEIFQCDDEDSGREVLVYENEEGQTVMLPVEYLEDSLYDQIFGSADTPIGGSMPDLPGGQMSELKKGSLSYKLSRRSRGDRFVPSSRRPCSFFLEGNCRRSDCKFSHDLLTITCRFWEEGSCLKGDTCPFRHGFPIPSPPRNRRRNRSEGDQTSLVEPLSFASLKEGNGGSGGGKGRPIPRRGKGTGSVGSIGSFELDSEADFPCLGSSVESKMDSLDEMTFPANVRVTKVPKKKKKFITVTKSMFKGGVPENEKGQFKWGGASRKSKNGRNISNDHLVGAEGKGGTEESVKGGGGTGNGTARKKKKEKVGKDPHSNHHAKECESLRKVLRKRYSVPPHQPPFSHEDGTFSDF